MTFPLRCVEERTVLKRAVNQICCSPPEIGTVYARARIVSLAATLKNRKSRPSGEKVGDPAFSVPATRTIDASSRRRK